MKSKKRNPVARRVGGWCAASAAVGVVAAVVLSQAGQALGGMLQQKDLAFAQVAAGPEFESVISVTNRGVATYLGFVRFWGGRGSDWNPRVNGQRVLGSRMRLAIEPGCTKILRVDDDTLAAGAVAILAEDPAQDNFVEGHLTYFRRGPEHDSVGIAPATGLYRSAVPFEDFQTVGLALANPEGNGPANVRLRLLDERGSELETVVRDLPERSHEARFLSEIFTAEAQTGKVEIGSDAPILGTAVTFAGGEISSLPLLASPVSYTLRFRSQGRTDEAEAALWAEGEFVKGYIRFLSTNGVAYPHPSTYRFTGTILDGVLRLTQVGAGPNSGVAETVNVIRVPNFSFDRHSYSGAYTRMFPWLSFPLSQVLGTYEMVRKD